MRTAEAEEIVSSVRIFKRKLSTGSADECINAGGIGEVCTSMHHRKRGLAKVLLNNAIDAMEKEEGMDCSLLHAAPAFVPVYQKVGYECVRSSWSLVEIEMINMTQLVQKENLQEKTKIRLAEFPKDTERLRHIHKSYSEDRFAGCVIRSTAYWNEYICKEIGSSLLVLTIPNEEQSGDYIVAWISVRPRNGRFQLRDFGVDCSVAKEHGMSKLSIFAKLLMSALPQEKGVLTLHLPSPILEDIKAGQHEMNLFPNGSISEDDDGWMYKKLNDSAENMVRLVKVQPRPHFIWPSDSF
jgi:predicted GNAT family N-acyltransferase